jgi:hypothetical protein
MYALSLSSAQVSVHSSVIEGNKAIYGAGISAGRVSRVELDDSRVLSNSASEIGGGLSLAQTAFMVAMNCTITSNDAKHGGGLALRDNATVPEAAIASVRKNSARFSPDVYAEPLQFFLLNNLSEVLYVSRATSADGQLVVHAILLGLHGIVVPDAMAEVYLDSATKSVMLGSNRSDAQGNLYFVLRTRQPPGRYNMRMSLTNFARIPEVNLSVVVRPCIVGEVAPIPDTCEPCVPGFYSLDPNLEVCNVCPSGATCPGGAAVVPQPGWWHSAATSAQMHR